MNRDKYMRGVLWGATVYNTLCALLIAFPASTPGQLAGLPEQVPLSYRVMTALMVLLWAGAYARETVPRSTVIAGG